MQLLNLTRPTPAENLALDEALLDEAVEQEQQREQQQADLSPVADGELLRLWELPAPCVVVGSSSRVAVEVNRRQCDVDRIPILRRVSGGTSVVVGPGCLLYSVILSYRRRPELRDLDQAHRWVLGRLSAALARYVPAVTVAGISDLVMGERKFSGNSVRCKRTHLLYHGTLLYDFDLRLISRYLDQAVRTPAYRGTRSHADFVTNLPLSREVLQQAVIDAFDAHDNRASWPAERTAALCFGRYLDPAWHLRM